METGETSRRRPGRPLSFDRAAALRQAMLLFWRQGYEATSISALTAAMRVTPPSLYAAFGDKKALFREAVALYLAQPVVPEAAALAEPATALEFAERLLQGSVIVYTGEDTPPGCLLATSTISCSPAAADLQSESAALRLRVEAGLRGRIGRDVEHGELPADVDAETLAGHVMAVLQGLSTLARDGAPRAKLERIARSALAGWPSCPPPAGV